MEPVGYPKGLKLIPNFRTFLDCLHRCKYLHHPADRVVLLHNPVDNMNRWAKEEDTVTIQTTEPPNRMKNTKSRTNQPGGIKAGADRKKDDFAVGANYVRDEGVKLILGAN